MGIIWTIWFIQTVFNMVIMLNFMIAIVSASYERVMASKNQFLFQYKSYMNQALAIFEARFFSSKNLDIVVMLTNEDEDDDEEGDDVQGVLNEFRHMIQKVIDKQYMLVLSQQKQINRCRKELDDLQVQIPEMKQQNKVMIKSELKSLQQEIVGM